MDPAHQLMILSQRELLLNSYATRITSSDKGREIEIIDEEEEEEGEDDKAGEETLRNDETRSRRQRRWEGASRDSHDALDDDRGVSDRSNVDRRTLWYAMKGVARSGMRTLKKGAGKVSRPLRTPLNPSFLCCFSSVKAESTEADAIGSLFFQ